MKVWIEIDRHKPFLHLEEPTPDDDGEIWNSDNEAEIYGLPASIRKSIGVGNVGEFELNLNRVWERA